MTRASHRSGDAWKIGCWLIFDSNGGVRLTRTQPSLARDERAMSMEFTVPMDLFRVPTLRASVTIEAPPPGVAPIDLTAAADALKATLGCDIDVQIVQPQ